MSDRRFFWIEVLLLGLIVGAWWATPPPAVPKTGLNLAKTVVVEAEYSPMTGTYQKLIGLDTAQTLTVPAGAYRCVFIVEDDAVRWTDDGTNPDPATKVGAAIAAGDYLPYSGDLDAIELKGSAATIVHVFYYSL